MSDEELVKINPEKLTPASRRTLHGIMISYFILVIAVSIAFGVFAKQTAHVAQVRAVCAASQVAWDETHLSDLKLTDPLPTDVPGLSPSSINGRKNFNEITLTRRIEIFQTLGPRPVC